MLQLLLLLLLLVSFLFIYKFIYFWLHWVFIAAHGLSLVVVSRDYYLLWCVASYCSGFSCCGTWALGAWASVVVAPGFSSCGLWALEHRLSICGTQAQLLHGMWDLPGPGLEPMSPELACGFSTTAPPGKPLLLAIKRYDYIVKPYVVILPQLLTCLVRTLLVKIP